MTALTLALLVAVFFFTSLIGVVTGANSLITVPTMLQVGIDPRVAIATNMLALTFLSVGGTLPFLGRGVLERRRLPLLVILTLFGSVLGALLVLVVAAEALPLLIAVFMLVIVLFMLLNREAGMKPRSPTRAGEAAGYAATFALGVYGGFFSGGYVTLLTAAYVAFFGMTFLQAVATTKVVNVFSSLTATLVFTAEGLIDYPLGLVLSFTMFIGGLIGARLALRLDALWLRRLFLAVVVLLALKTLLYDGLSNVLSTVLSNALWQSLR